MVPVVPMRELHQSAIREPPKQHHRESFKSFNAIAAKTTTRHSYFFCAGLPALAFLNTHNHLAALCRLLSKVIHFYPSITFANHRQATNMITPALANAEDMARLADLEDKHLLPEGTTYHAAMGSIAYLVRIAYLIETSHGQRVPKVS